MAGTKTFATQMVSQYLVALYLAQVRGSMFPEEIAEILERMDELPGPGPARDRAGRRRSARWPSGSADARDVLFIGRHTGYPAALEGALKLKELSYIHAEGFPAGELKHGPIALDRGRRAGRGDRHASATCTRRCSRTSRRCAPAAREVIAIATEGDEQIGALADHVLEVPRTPELLSPVVVTVPLQLFAYHIAKLRGCDVDQPRNLAKSVTVE